MASKKKITKKSSVGSEPPQPPRNERVDAVTRMMTPDQYKAYIGQFSQSPQASKLDNDIQMRQRDLANMQYTLAKQTPKTPSSQRVTPEQIRAVENQISSMKANAPRDSRHHSDQISRNRAKAEFDAQLEKQIMKNRYERSLAANRANAPLRGRTVEYGTRSMLEGVRNWIRGGGGLRSHGK